MRGPSRKYLVQAEIQRMEEKEKQLVAKDEAQQEAVRKKPVDIFSQDRLVKAKEHMRQHRFQQVMRDLNGKTGDVFSITTGPRAIVYEGNRFCTQARLTREQIIHRDKVSKARKTSAVQSLQLPAKFPQRPPKDDKLLTARQKERASHERHMQDIKQRDGPKKTRTRSPVGGRLATVLERPPVKRELNKGGPKLAKARKEGAVRADNAILARKVMRAKSDYDQKDMEEDWGACRRHFRRLMGPGAEEKPAKSKLTWQHPKGPAPTKFVGASIFMRQDAFDKPMPWKRTSYGDRGGTQQDRNIEFDRAKMKWVDEKGRDLDKVLRLGL